VFVQNEDKDEEEKEQEEESVSIETMRLELKRVVLNLLQTSIISIPFLNWDPESTDKRERDAIRRVGTIFGAYQVQTWFWELSEMLRKFMMVGLLVFISPGEPAQLGVALLITLFFLFAQLILQPFSTPELNQMQAISQASLTMTLFVGLMMIIDAYTKKESDLAASGFWGVDQADSMQEIKRLIFSLFAVIVNFTTMVLPPLLMAKNLTESLPNPSQVLGLIRAKYYGMKETIKSAISMFKNTPPPEEQAQKMSTEIATDVGDVALGSATVRSVAVGSVVLESSKNKLSRPISSLSPPPPLQPAAQNVDVSESKIPGHEVREPALIDFPEESSEKSSGKTPDRREIFITDDEYRQELLKGSVKTLATSQKDLEDRHPELIQHSSISTLTLQNVSSQSRLSKFASSGKTYNLENDSFLLLRPPAREPQIFSGVMQKVQNTQNERTNQSVQSARQSLKIKLKEISTSLKTATENYHEEHVSQTTQHADSQEQPAPSDRRSPSTLLLLRRVSFVDVLSFCFVLSKEESCVYLVL